MLEQHHRAPTNSWDRVAVPGTAFALAHYNKPIDIWQWWVAYGRTWSERETGG